MPDLDIIIAAHERPDFLAAELESIAQARKFILEKVEITVVDDASADRRVKDVAEWAGVRYIRREVNGGVAETLAEGFRSTSAPLYSFWGDDDLMLPDWFEFHLSAIENADVVSSSYRLINQTGEDMGEMILPVATLADLRNDICTANDGSLTRREWTERVGLHPEYGRAMMLRLWLDLAKAGARFVTLARPTWLYRRHGSNLSGQWRSPRDPSFQALRDRAIAEAFA